MLDRGTWRPPPVFGLLARHGGIADAEMERVFNLGIGMIAVVAPDAAGPALGLLAARGVPAWVAGQVTTGSGEAVLTGVHPGRD
jgi:phosphoribosylformylglycinamidine cyclo-ligase